MYEVTLQLIQTYAKCNSGTYVQQLLQILLYHIFCGGAGKYSKASLVEEEQCEDLLLFMKLLSYLTTKSYCDFGPVETAGPREAIVEAVDVVMSGINTVLPLITDETLKVSTMVYSHYHNHHHNYDHYCSVIVSAVQKPWNVLGWSRQAVP